MTAMKIYYSQMPSWQEASMFKEIFITYYLLSIHFAKSKDKITHSFCRIQREKANMWPLVITYSSGNQIIYSLLQEYL